MESNICPLVFVALIYDRKHALDGWTWLHYRAYLVEIALYWLSITIKHLTKDDLCKQLEWQQPQYLHCISIQAWVEYLNFSKNQIRVSLSLTVRCGLELIKSVFFGVLIWYKNTPHCTLLIAYFWNLWYSFLTCRLTELSVTEECS